MISEEFKQNVSSGDLDTVRSALIDYLIIDRTFRSFDESLEYAKNSMDILESYNSESPFAEEPWNSNYLNQQKVALMMNFSLERIEHIKKVISAAVPEHNTAPRSNESEPQSQQGSRTESRTGKKVVSETALPKPKPKKNPINRPTTGGQDSPKLFSTHSPEHSTNAGAKGTGARVVCETVSSPKRREEKGKTDADILGTSLIVGGFAVAAVGIATVEPLVVGAGVVIAGAGVGVKVKKRR